MALNRVNATNLFSAIYLFIYLFLIFPERAFSEMHGPIFMTLCHDVACIVECFFYLLAFFLKGMGAKNAWFWPFCVIPLPVNGLLFIRNRNKIENSKTNSLSMGAYFHRIGYEVRLAPLKNVVQFGHGFGNSFETTTQSQSPGGSVTTPPCSALHSSFTMLHPIIGTNFPSLFVSLIFKTTHLVLSPNYQYVPTSVS